MRRLLPVLLFLFAALAPRGAVADTNEAFSAVMRCCPSDVTSNTRWILNLRSDTRGFSIGFAYGKIRLYAHKTDVVLPDIPVKTNQWIDLGISVSWGPELVDGVQVVTGRCHIVIADQATGAIRTVDVFDSGNLTPCEKSVCNIAAETLTTEALAEVSGQPAKRCFNGRIQQVAFWRRRLSDAEFAEAFRTPIYGEVPLPEGDYSSDTTTVSVPVGKTNVITVAADRTRILSAGVKGGGVLVKKGAGTLRFETNNPNFTGEIDVREGTIEALDRKLTTPFGTGGVTVRSASRGRVVVAGTLSNRFFFDGASDDAHPALHFASTTELKGDIEADSDLCLSTAWEETVREADVERVKLSGQVTVAGTLALAPHCRVRFTKPIACDILDLYWRTNSAAADGGNPGAVVLASCGDYKNGSGVPCRMNRVRIDQTRVIQGGQNVFGGGTDATYHYAALEWTGRHRTGGSIDLNGYKCCLGEIVTPPTDLADETSMRIIQPGAAWMNFYATPSSTLYLRLEGAITCQAPSSDLVFANRRHLMTGTFNAPGRSVVFSNASFACACVFKVSSKNGSFAFVDCADPRALAAGVRVELAKRGGLTFDASAIAALADYTMCISASNAATNSVFTLPSGCPALKLAAWQTESGALAEGHYTGADLRVTMKPKTAEVWVGSPPFQMDDFPLAGVNPDEFCQWLKQVGYIDHPTPALVRAFALAESPKGGTLADEFLAGTDPSDDDSTFRATISLVDGRPVIGWQPDLNAGGTRQVRRYTTYGKRTLLDRDWTVVPEGHESDFNFFKVEVDWSFTIFSD